MLVVLVLAVTVAIAVRSLVAIAVVEASQVHDVAVAETALEDEIAYVVAAVDGKDKFTSTNTKLQATGDQNRS